MEKQLLILILLLAILTPLVTSLQVSEEDLAVGSFVTIESDGPFEIRTPSNEGYLFLGSGNSEFPLTQQGTYTFMQGEEVRTVNSHQAAEVIIERATGKQPFIAIWVQGVLRVQKGSDFRVDVNDFTGEILRIDENPRRQRNFARTYAIDPEIGGFSSAEITVRATGSSLYKCEEYDYLQDYCFGSWQFVQPITPGQFYTVTVDEVDPVFGEGDADSQPETCAYWDQSGTTKGVVNGDCRSEVLFLDNNWVSLDDIEGGGSSEIQTSFSNERSIAEVNELNVTYTWYRIPSPSPPNAIGPTTATIQVYISGSWQTACTTTVPEGSWQNYKATHKQ
ncbi:MAG: hypothetical protein ACMXYD_03895 [Candidatus Woesearchaeota archaeon]